MQDPFSKLLAASRASFAHTISTASLLEAAERDRSWRDEGCRVRLREMTGMPNPKVAALVSAIRAGEDTELELKEVVFRGDRLSFAAEEGRAASKLAEVFVSMANTRGGTIVMGVRDSDRAVVGMAAGKRILVIAGPNGAGKTTFAMQYLPNEGDCPTFVNGDLIAAGLNPFRPDLRAARAGRLVLSEIAAHVRSGHSFAFETTLSGRGYARRIPRWCILGYRVTLIFLRLATPEEAVDRVRRRVLQGGHDVPDSVVRRRFRKGWRNFEQVYRDLVDEWIVYDNSGDVPLLVDRGVRQ